MNNHKAYDAVELYVHAIIFICILRPNLFTRLTSINIDQKINLRLTQIPED